MAAVAHQGRIQLLPVHTYVRTYACALPLWSPPACTYVRVDPVYLVGFPVLMCVLMYHVCFSPGDVGTPVNSGLLPGGCHHGFHEKDSWPSSVCLMYLWCLCVHTVRTYVLTFAVCVLTALSVYCRLACSMHNRHLCIMHTYVRMCIRIWTHTSECELHVHMYYVHNTVHTYLYSMCLFVCPSIFLSVCLCPSVCICLYLSISVCLFVTVCLCLAGCICLCLFVCVWLCLAVCV